MGKKIFVCSVYERSSYKLGNTGNGAKRKVKNTKGKGAERMGNKPTDETSNKK